MAEANNEPTAIPSIEKENEGEQSIPVGNAVEIIPTTLTDKEIPIEDLRKLYTSPTTLNTAPISKDDQNDNSSSDDDDDSDQRRLLIAENPQTNENGEDVNGDDNSVPSYWQKSINIGDQYQATIPDLISTIESDLYEDEILWAPAEENILDENCSNLVKFLKSAAKEFRSVEQEFVLKTFLSENYDGEKTLEKLRSISEEKSFVQMKSWSLAECEQFEQEFKDLGKSFSDFKIPNRTTKELIYFYYIWKKTARHDVFVRQNRVEKRRFHLHPFVTDYLEKFFIEQETQLSQAFEQNNGSFIANLNPQSNVDILLSKRRSSSDLFLKPNFNGKRSKSSVQTNEQDLNRPDSPSTNRSSTPTGFNKKFSDENQINTIDNV